MERGTTGIVRNTCLKMEQYLRSLCNEDGGTVPSQKRKKNIGFP